MTDEASPSNYVRLSDAVSPHAQYKNIYFPYVDDADSEADEGRLEPEQPWWRSWWHQLSNLGSSPAEHVESGYLTLIPLSDARLKPRRTKLIVGMLLLITLASMCATYFLVARGVTVGTIQVHSSHMSFNTSKSTYQIILTATLPIYNPNYLSVRVSGTVNVSFYDQQAGFNVLEPMLIPARAMPQVIQVDMDASSVPVNYLFTIYTQCFTFPEKLIFFLTGKLQAGYLGSVYKLPDIDNYFIISCTNDSNGSTIAATEIHKLH